MDHNAAAGYREIDHTADWELAVWADSLPELFRQAALGMYALSGVTVSGADFQAQTITLQASSLEGLLVKFLHELLYLGEDQQQAAQAIEVELAAEKLHAVLQIGTIATQTKEIKAVTYHNLSIRQEGEIYRVNVIFDV